MENQLDNLDNVLLTIMDQFAIDGKYKLKNNQGDVKVYTINSLKYIPLNQFIKIAEEIMKIRIPLHLNDYVYSKFYIEDINNFIPEVSKAICTNFLDSKIFNQIKKYCLENGATQITDQTTQVKKSIFEMNEFDLYKSIIEDDDFLSKEFSKSRQNNNQRLIEGIKSNNTENLNSKNYQNHYEDSNDTTMREDNYNYNTINSVDVFSMNPTDVFKINQSDIFSMNPYDHLQSNTSFNNMNVRGNGKPRGKQMNIFKEELAERQFPCNYPGCQRAFKRFEHLKRHIKMHTGEKPFKCTFPNCSRGFSRSDNLNAHYKTHIGVKGGIKKIKNRISNKKRFSHKN
ncbi:Z856 [Hepatospora eriocheir]|uniref:Z856 n=1 Tax=Hepatospora eriocheir TaxID=1081669 RepID=A0A1X0QGJ5_9MICR|nr:Z856 [Hepatospora eriocheir]